MAHGWGGKVQDTYPKVSSIVTHAKASSAMVLGLGHGASSAESLCLTGHCVSVALSLCSLMVWGRHMPRPEVAVTSVTALLPQTMFRAESGALLIAIWDVSALELGPPFIRRWPAMA